MNHVVNFTHIQYVIENMAHRHGVTVEDMKNSWNPQTDDFDWHWNYQLPDQHTEFIQQLIYMNESIRLHEAAIAQGDMLAARKGILMASLAAQNLSGFFNALTEDLDKVIRDSEYFQWPEFPDPYQVPECYNYKGL